MDPEGGRGAWGPDPHPLENKSQSHILVMGGSRNFRQGGPGQSDKKKHFFFFLALSLFYRSQMVNFKEIYHFSRFQSNLFQGGSNCLFPIETHITCGLPGGGGVRTPCPPLWIRTCWSGPPRKSQSYPASIQCWAIMGSPRSVRFVCSGTICML